MSDARKRGAHRRTFRLEGLEGRELLSVAKPAADVHINRLILPGPPTAVSTFQGRVAGTAASNGLYAGRGPIFASYSGHGSAGVFGGVLFGQEFVPNPSTTVPGGYNLTNGSMLFTTLKGGNQLRVNFNGTATPDGKGRLFWSFTGAVASGTGRFAGATGSFRATGVAQAASPGQFSLNYVVAFDPAR